MDIKAKLRPFYVAQMLYERTDDEHYLTIVQMMEILEKEYGISTSRGTVGDDIKALQEFGMEIEVEPSTQNRYYLIGRKFDLPELKALILTEEHNAREKKRCTKHHDDCNADFLIFHYHTSIKWDRPLRGLSGKYALTGLGCHELIELCIVRESVLKRNE